MDIAVLGIDLGKTLCSLAGVDGTGAVVLRRRVQRFRLLELLAQLPPCTVAMEDGAALPQDILSTTLSGFVEAGRFKARYAGPARGAIEENFEQNLAKIYARAETPRLSDVQIKAPMVSAVVPRSA